MGETITPKFYANMDIEALISERDFWFEYSVKSKALGIVDASAKRTVKHLDRLITEKNVHLKFVSITNGENVIVGWMDLSKGVSYLLLLAAQFYGAFGLIADAVLEPALLLA